MPLTEKIDLPFEKPEEKKTWTSKVLFSVGSVVSKATKIYSANEIMLFFGILISGICESLGRSPSMGWYVLMLFLVGIEIYLRIVKDILSKDGKKSLD